MVGYNSDSLLDSLPDFPPSSLPDLTFPAPTFEPGESGVIFGIGFNF